MNVAVKSRLVHEAIKPRIGSRILNSKAELLSGELAAEIRDLLEQRGVLVFPKVSFTDDEQIATKLEGGSYFLLLANEVLHACEVAVPQGGTKLSQA